MLSEDDPVLLVRSNACSREPLNILLLSFLCSEIHEYTRASWCNCDYAIMQVAAHLAGELTTVQTPDIGSYFYSMLEGEVQDT